MAVIEADLGRGKQMPVSNSSRPLASGYTLTSYLLLLTSYFKANGVGLHLYVYSMVHGTTICGRTSQ